MSSNTESADKYKWLTALHESLIDYIDKSFGNFIELFWQKLKDRQDEQIAALKEDISEIRKRAGMITDKEVEDLRAENKRLRGEAALTREFGPPA